MIDFGALSQPSTLDSLIDPRDIFNAIPTKPQKMGFLRGPQDQVLNKWFRHRKQRDIVIKLNTGGGKTLIGLLIALSSLAEGKGPAVYLVPDCYLVDQVTAEAKLLGIETTTDPESFSYAQGKAIFVGTFQKLFNGRSVFGVSGSIGRPPSVSQPGTVIIDDVHACLNRAEQVFRLTIPSSHNVYQKLLNLFELELKEQSPTGYSALIDKESTGIQQVPYWTWQDKQKLTLEALQTLANEEGFRFSWPLIADILPICRAVFSSDALEIEPSCLPSEIVAGFNNAQRRVYLTATLADDGVLISSLGVKRKTVIQPLTPINAGDIGDRLILVPQQVYPQATEDEIRDLVLRFAADQNVVVIVPSVHRAKYWQPYASQVLNKDNLTEGIKALRHNPRIGLTVLINRYDGIDLPGDACHFLVVDGLPEAMSGMERIDQAQLAGSKLLLARQVQRLEQGMGRATRSNDDYCVVLLLGRRLAERLHGKEARSYFSPATRAQIKLSNQVSEQLEGTSLEPLYQAAQQCLDRDPNWLRVSKAHLAKLRYKKARVSDTVTPLRHAFELATANDFGAALKETQKAIDSSRSDVEKGFLLQQYAAYQHHINPGEAQETQKAAHQINRNLLRPRKGIEPERLDGPPGEQAVLASSYLQNRYRTANDLLLSLKALIGDLAFGVKAEIFEQAWHELADHLGFKSQRPERDTGRGPDNLWLFVNGVSHVIEAKSEVKESLPVYKKHAEQLSNSMDWFRGLYGEKACAVPVLIHPQELFDSKAAIPTGCRVIPKGKLEELQCALETYSEGLAHENTFRNPTRLRKLLASLQLTASSFLPRYSTTPRKL